METHTTLFLQAFKYKMYLQTKIQNGKLNQFCINLFQRVESTNLFVPDVLNLN